MSKGESSQLERLIEAVLASSKYKSICRDFVADIGSRELAKQHTLKEAIKATKNKLHQVGGAYLNGEVRYRVWLDEFKRACLSGNREHIRQVCIRMMARHASTRERVPLLEEFYTTILADMPPIRSVLDVACGLHPLAIPWMPLAEDAQYYAYDIYQDMMAFLNEYLRLMHLQGHAQVCDVIQYCPQQKVDVAFILKAIPCLEQVDKSVGLRLLETISADALVVSFPAYSLGGRHKGMSVNYEARFRQLVAGKNWSISRFEFPTELVFLVRK
jgi:16S rRNA (guanine(1405)-N(7))-methyltransferase